MIPNDAEQKLFQSGFKTPAHVVILCDSVRNSLEQHQISVADIASNDISITLNGIEVHQVLNLKLYERDSQCFMLYGKHTFLWPMKNKERQFNLGIKANVEEGMLRLSSIIII